jgi:hypothetical protein
LLLVDYQHKKFKDMHPLPTGHPEKSSKICIFIVECANGQEIEVKTRMDLLIPLVILVLCFLLSLGVNIYQRRLIQNSNRQPCQKCETSEQANRKGELGMFNLSPNLSFISN